MVGIEISAQILVPSPRFASVLLRQAPDRTEPSRHPARLRLIGADLHEDLRAYLNANHLAPKDILQDSVHPNARAWR